jgi:hypothetical protein
LAGNLVKPLLSLYGTEWRERGYGLCRDTISGKITINSNSRVPATACSKGTAETPTTPGRPSIAGRQGTEIHQEPKYASKSSDTSNKQQQ